MKAALASLRTGIQELRQHIEMMEIERELLAVASAARRRSASDKIAKRFREHVGRGVVKRRFDYNCIIIFLYGLIEQYLEALVTAYVATINKIVPTYDELPRAILALHVTLTFGLMQKADQPKYKGLIDPAAVIANLHSCLNKQEAYRINALAFSAVYA